MEFSPQLNPLQPGMSICLLWPSHAVQDHPNHPHKLNHPRPRPKPRMVPHHECKLRVQHPVAPPRNSPNSICCAESVDECLRNRGGFARVYVTGGGMRYLHPQLSLLLLLSQGYLAHKTPAPPLGPQRDPSYSPTLGS